MTRAARGPAVTAAERRALDVVAREQSARWEARGRRVSLLKAGRRRPVRMHALRRTVADARLPPPRLRFDRVALRVCRDLRAAATTVLPAGRLGFVTLQAPIREATQAVAWITDCLRVLGSRPPAKQLRSACVRGNRLRLATMPAPRRCTARLLCLVHSSAADAPRLLAMAQDLLRISATARPRPEGWLVMTTPERSALSAVYRHLFEALHLQLPCLGLIVVFGDGNSVRLTD